MTATSTLHCDGASAEIHHHGAHVLSFVPAGGTDVLWVSKQAVFRDGKAIRGGIPVCWPWFGDHPDNPDLPAHGLARTRTWTLESKSEAALTLLLCDSDESRALWPHAFELRLHAQLSAGAIEIRLEATNTGDQAVTTSAALHTYFSVSDVRQISISGLEDTAYIDKLDGGAVKRQNGGIDIAEEVDRIYTDTTADCLLDDPASLRRIRVAKSGSRSTVIWNPWIEKAKRMSDFGDDEYPEMVCIETTNAGPDLIEIAPGASHTLMTRISTEAAN